MKNILVTAIGSFAADIVIKNLIKEGHIVTGTDIYPKEWIVDAYSVHHFYQVPLVTDSENYFKSISDICRNEKIQYIFPLTDVEVDFYNTHRKEFEQLGVCVCISGRDTIDIVRDKKKLEQYITENTKVYTIPTEKIVDFDEKTEKFPVICKPNNGRSSQGIRIISNRDEWKGLWKYQNPDNYIVQPFIKGNIVTVDVIRQEEKGIIVTAARRELLRTLNGAGTSVYVYPDDKLSDSCEIIAETLKIKGCVNFEFIQDDEKEYYFLECNPRFSGGVEFSCMAGYDFVNNHLKCFTGETVEEFGRPKKMYIARKYEEYVTCVEDES